MTPHSFNSFWESPMTMISNKQHGTDRGVYTMDCEVVIRPCKIWDWLFNSSWDHFGLHQAKNVRVTMEFTVPKDIFKGLNYLIAYGPTGFVMGEAK
jgi:hypothetical protein